MNSEFYKENIGLLKFQRNVFLSLCLFLAVTSSILSIFLFQKSDRVVIVPPVVEKSFWIDANQVSATYLEQFGLFLGQLILTKSPQTSKPQRETVMKHTSPEYAGVLNKKLLEEEQMLFTQNASYVFFPVDIIVDYENLQVNLIGERTTYVSGKAVSTVKEGYRIGFNSKGARLLLNRVSSIGDL